MSISNVYLKFWLITGCLVVLCVFFSNALVFLFLVLAIAIVLFPRLRVVSSTEFLFGLIAVAIFVYSASLVAGGILNMPGFLFRCFQYLFFLISIWVLSRLIFNENILWAIVYFSAAHSFFRLTFQYDLIGANANSDTIYFVPLTFWLIFCSSGEKLTWICRLPIVFLFLFVAWVDKSFIILLSIFLILFIKGFGFVGAGLVLVGIVYFIFLDIAFPIWSASLDAFNLGWSREDVEGAFRGSVLVRSYGMGAVLNEMLQNYGFPLGISFFSEAPGHVSSKDAVGSFHVPILIIISEFGFVALILLWRMLEKMDNKLLALLFLFVVFVSSFSLSNVFLTLLPYIFVNVMVWRAIGSQKQQKIA